MVENGIAILSLDEILAMADNLYFPVSGIGVTSRVSWATMKADLLGGYELWPHDIPGSTDEILTVRNTNLTDEFTIFEIRSPDYGATLETTLALHNYSAALGKDWVRDLSFHNYSGNMHGLDVISNFTDVAVYADWKWISYNPLGRGEYQAGRLYGATGNLVIAGIMQPSGGYKSADGSSGATGTFTAGTKAVTVKDGIITGIV